MQYFVGLTHFTVILIFAASIFVTLCKRICIEDINKICLILIETDNSSTHKDEKKNTDEDNDTPSPSEEGEK